MAQPSKTLIERKTFSRGLITEANALTFPENASREEINFTLNRDGSRRRRLGMEYEVGAIRTTTDVNFTTASGMIANCAVYRWNAVGGVVGNDNLVVAVGSSLYVAPLSKGSKISSGSFTRVCDSYTNNGIRDFTTINGDLIMVRRIYDGGRVLVVHPDLTYEDVYLKVRDLWGVADGLAVDNRPTTLSDAHKYNLLNQGWPSDKLTAVYGTTSNAYPSNADIPTVCTKSDGGWDVNAIDYALFGTTPAPKGKYITKVASRGYLRETSSGIANLNADYAPYSYAGCCASYAGRLFVGMQSSSSSVVEKEDTAPILTNVILFSQVVTTKDDLEKCYQNADPTALNSEGLVASDGGFIQIQEAETIHRLIPTNNGLVVLASNGIWMISGPDNIFAADNYSIVKISSMGCTSRDSVIISDQSLFYWSDSGIYVLQPDSVSGRFTSSSLSENTIQTMYNVIPDFGKRHSIGIYDASERKCRWMYSSIIPTDETAKGKIKYTHEIVFDIVLQSFYVYNVYSDTDTYIGGYCDSSGYVAASGEEEVTDSSGVTVTTSGSAVITAYTSRTEERTQNVKYLTLREKSSESNYIQFAFSHYRRDDFKDFGMDDAAAYLVTGSEMAGDSFNRKQVNNLILHFNRTETGFDEIDGELVAENASSCLVNSMWDFANSQRANKWGTQFQGYRLKRPYFASGPSDSFDYGWEIITTKNKLRGSGKALALRFETEPEKDCHLLGWVIDMENSNEV